MRRRATDDEGRSTGFFFATVGKVKVDKRGQPTSWNAKRKNCFCFTAKEEVL